MTNQKRMLSIKDLQERYGVSYGKAYAIMQTLPTQNIAPPNSRYKTLRVSQWALEQYEKQRRVNA